MSISRSLAMASVAVAALVAVVPAALARPSFSDAYEQAYQADPPEGFQPRQSALTGELCIKQCPNDMLPCDPPSFKIADGRCNGRRN